MIELLENFKKGKLWSKENFKILHLELKEFVFSVFVCNKHTKTKLPKPLTFYIIDLLFSAYYLNEEKEN